MVLPAGGAPLSGSLMVISVGVASYGLSRSCAVAMPAAAPLELVDPPDEALELLELSSEPQAANAKASTSVAMMAGNPRVWVIDLSPCGELVEAGLGRATRRSVRHGAAL